MLIFYGYAAQLKLWSKPNFLKVIHVNSLRGVSVHWSAGQEECMCVCVCGKRKSVQLECPCWITDQPLHYHQSWPPVCESLWSCLMLQPDSSHDWRFLNWGDFLEFTLWLALSVHVQISLSLSVFLSHAHTHMHTETEPLLTSWAEGFGEEPATSAEANFPRLPQGYLSMIPIGL